MKIYNLIDDDTRAKLNAVHRPKKNNEKLSERELKELMNVNTPTYKKIKGRTKQR